MGSAATEADRLGDPAVLPGQHVGYHRRRPMATAPVTFLADQVSVRDQPGQPLAAVGHRQGADLGANEALDDVFERGLRCHRHHARRPDVSVVHDHPPLAPMLFDSQHRW